MSDRLIRALLPDQGLRLAVIDARETVASAILRHQLRAGAAVPLGRALMGAMLLLHQKPKSDRFTLQFQSEGPLRGLVADAYADGSLRGYVHVPSIRFPVEDMARLSHAALGRRGIVSLIREMEGGRQEQGQVELVTGGIDRDLELGVERSEGERSAFGLEVVLRAEDEEQRKLEVLSAQGLCLLGLPDHDPYAYDDLARLVRNLKPAESAHELLEHVIGKRSFEILDEQAIAFRCRCSLERATSTLLLLGEAELLAIAADPGFAEVTCHYCGHNYRFEKDALALLVETSLESKGENTS